MKVKRLILNMIMVLTLAVSAGVAVNVPAYAAKAKGGNGGNHKNGGNGGNGGDNNGGNGGDNGGGGNGGDNNGGNGGNDGGGGGGGDGGGGCPTGQDPKSQVLGGLGETGSDCSDSQVNKTIQTVVTILSLVIGIASVIVIMIAGFKYIASAGDQNKVASAKGTLIYALVGLAVAALTQFLIHFVLANTNNV